MAYISLKLPNNIVAIHLPAFTTTAQTSDVEGSLRWTRNRNDRVTRGGNLRSTHYSVTSYPELVACKLDNGIITLPVEV
jgi:hypothetical protein